LDEIRGVGSEQIAFFDDNAFSRQTAFSFVGLDGVRDPSIKSHFVERFVHIDHRFSFRFRKNDRFDGTGDPYVSLSSN
jgi:hypothetical protein